MLNLILNTPSLTLVDRRRVEASVWQHSWGNLIRPMVQSTCICVCVLGCFSVHSLLKTVFFYTGAICANLKGSWRAPLTEIRMGIIPNQISQRPIIGDWQIEKNVCLFTYEYTIKAIGYLLALETCFTNWFLLTDLCIYQKMHTKFLRNNCWA